MSSEKFEKYKALYSEYIDNAVAMHNYHQVFIKRRGVRPNRAARDHLRNLIRLEKALWKASIEAYKECLENYKKEKPHSPNKREGKPYVRNLKSYKKNV